MAWAAVRERGPTRLMKHSNVVHATATLPLGVIPYDHPESLIDAVEIDPSGRRILAYLDAREECCQGRSIGQPIFPGSRLGDCLYLAFSILIGQSPAVPARVRDGYIGVRALDRNFRYRRPIRPHDRVVLDIRLKRQHRQTCIASARVSVDGELVFEADELWITLVPPNYQPPETSPAQPDDGPAPFPGSA